MMLEGKVPACDDSHLPLCPHTVYSATSMIVSFWTSCSQRRSRLRLSASPWCFLCTKRPCSRYDCVIHFAGFKAVGESVEKPELKLYDKVRNEQGREYEVIAEPRAVENGLLKVALWNEEIGFDWDYPENLEVIS